VTANGGPRNGVMGCIGDSIRGLVRNAEERKADGARSKRLRTPTPPTNR